MTRPLTRTLWSLAAFLSVAVAIFSYRYLPRMGLMDPEILANLFARPWLDVHVAGAATALLLGPFQFLPGLREKHWRLHRWMGRTYVIGCIAGGIGGFIMAFGTTAGPVATVGFATLAVCWITANAQAWRMALARRFVEHREWMVRSIAMTFAAVMLRIDLLVLPLLGLSPDDAYVATAYVSWIPNLILAELYLRGAFARRPNPRRIAYRPSNSAVDR
ncbi:DUF2306 domain-containing protein [Phenylobacterium sp.]|uniref:DUF2306 domain-containing protein n=1 Tax=Phenylobacterium sp. TaxID=1871053 RepID=UPI002736983F|nr:DUF2306 domain-containing protein [Phenylobacterium sp.]MDP3852959.1 DUF2306 domain-containing protein [Phenylobacterium sp.]